MKRILILIAISSLLGCKALVPKKYRFSVSDERWNTILLAEPGSIPVLSDTMVVMYSNRSFHPERKKKLGDYIDSSGVVRIFLVVSKNKVWTIYPMSSVDQAVKYMGKIRPVLCYVEGMGKNFPIGVERAFSVSLQHDVTVIMMDYPSINIDYSAFKNFNYARSCSYRTAPSLIGLMKEIQTNKNAKEEWTNTNITLFHHSMGNIMLKRILQQGMDSSISPGLFDQLVLNAPCVDQDGHKKWLEKSRLAKKTFLHYNKDDKQLNGAKILAIKTQLGARLQRPLASDVQYVDFNPLVGDSHSNFIDIPMRPSIQPKAKAYYNKLFKGQTIDFSDTTFFGKGWKGIGVSLKK